MEPLPIVGVEPSLPGIFPVLTLRDIVVMPQLIVPLIVGRRKSLCAVEYALKGDKPIKPIFLLAQRSPGIDNPGADALFSIGTMSIILRMIRASEKGDRMKLLVQGLSSARINRLTQTDPFYMAFIDPILQQKSTAGASEIESLISLVKHKLDTAIFELSMTFPTDILMVVETLNDPDKLSYLIAGNLDLSVKECQEILEMEDSAQRLERISVILDREIEKRGD